MADEWEFIVFGVVRRAMKVMEYSKRACEGGGGGGIILKMDVTGNGLGGNGETGVRPCSVREKRNGSGGRGGVIVDAYAAFVGPNTELVDDGHVA